MPKLAFYCNILDDYHYWNIFQFTFFNIYTACKLELYLIWENLYSRMSIGIAGGGISGLSFALKASRISSKSIRIYEKDSNLGGWIQTVRTNSGKGSLFSLSLVFISLWLERWKSNLKSAIFECGPRSVRFAKQKEARFSISLLNELGLENDIIARDKTHPSSKYRFLWERLAQKMLLRL